MEITLFYSLERCAFMTVREQTEKIEIPDHIADTGDKNSIMQWGILLGIISVGAIALKKRSKKSENS